MMKKINFTIILLCILTGLTGCGEVQETFQEEIELLEPVNANVTAEVVERRTLYDADVYYANVLPYAEEYAFTENVKKVEFTAYPGDYVKAGEILVYSDTEKLDENIETAEEKLADMQAEYLEYQQETEAELEELLDDAEYYEEILENLEEDMEETDQYIVGADGLSKENPNYASLQKDYNKWEGKYRIQMHNVTMKEAALRQKKELYEMDHAYNYEKLKVLLEEREKYILRAGMSGQIVAIAQAEYGSFDAKADAGVVAVGDMSQKILKCEYISKDILSKAVEIYAMIDGKRYELEYHVVESDEYYRLKNNGETIYTTFVIKGNTEEIQMGDYAAITVVNKKCEQVVTVPKDAIQKDTTVHYVYVVENGESIRRDIKLGLSDGVYTEVLSGLEEGEMIKVQSPLKHGDKEAVVQKGSVHGMFMQTGYMYYPSVTKINNPISNGTVYHVETNVVLDQWVEKGDVIATVRVEIDELALKRDKLELQRMKERLQDIIDENEPEENAKEIAKKQEEIDELEQLVKGIEQDARTTQIKATTSGLLVSLEFFLADQVLGEECAIAEIATIDPAFVMVKNANQGLNCGDEVTITYEDLQEQKHVATGIVINVSDIGVSEELAQEYSFIQVAEEDVDTMKMINSEKAGWFSRSRFDISGVPKNMEDVLLVPKRAVTEVMGTTYVHVIDENGVIKPQCFIAGGHDSSNYWVIDGLTEGMKVCLE